MVNYTQEIYRKMLDSASFPGKLNNIDNISGKKLKENLENFREQAIFSKKLATIITEVPIEFDLDEIKSQESYDKEGLRRLFFKLQMKSMFDKLPKSDKDLEVTEESLNLITIDNLEELLNLSKSLDKVCYITYDVINSKKY